MAHIVKNANFLDLSPAQLDTLAHRAEQHRRFSSIDFKVLEVRPDAVVIRVRQTKSHAGNYFPVKRLIEILHETFDDMVGDRKIEPRPYPYRPSPPDVVDAAWLQARRGQQPVKDIAQDLGIDPNAVSGYIGGKKPLSGVVRAMFYYYFSLNRPLEIEVKGLRMIPLVSRAITLLAIFSMLGCGPVQTANEESNCKKSFAAGWAAGANAVIKAQNEGYLSPEYLEIKRTQDSLAFAQMIEKVAQ